MKPPHLFALALVLLLPSVRSMGETPAVIKPGDAVDCSKIVFYPKKWQEGGYATDLIPWQGEQITFLTVSPDHDPEIMTAFVSRLDAGWKLYADLTGTRPIPHREIDGKATIAALPGNGLTCGYGCGYVGATGIEMTHFYSDHYPRLQKDALDVPHAYFYEMGRNYFTFAGRHDCFTTGFAVFMRYVCMDRLGLNDTDKETRRIIGEAIDLYEKSDLPFLRTFTNADGLDEKASRLETSPSDQPVLYCSAMLRLWRDLGDDWLQAFFRQLAGCTESNGSSKAGAQRQCFHWFVAASCAAGRDLSDVFVGKWRLTLSDAQKAALKDVDWSKAKAEQIAAAAAN